MQLNRLVGSWWEIALGIAVLFGAFFSTRLDSLRPGPAPAYELHRIFGGKTADLWLRVDRYNTFEAALNKASTTANSKGDWRSVLNRSAQLSATELPETDMSVHEMQQVLRSTPDEDGAWSSLAWLLQLEGHTGPAIDAQGHAIALAPYDYTYYAQLGLYQQVAGLYDKAAESYANLILLSPRVLLSRFWKFISCKDPRISALALAQIRTTVMQRANFNGDISGQLAITRIRFELGDVAFARTSVDQLITELPNLSGLWELQGELDQAAGNPEAAIVEYNRSSYLDPSDPLPHEHLATIYLQRSDDIFAKEQLLAAIWRSKRIMSPGATRRREQYNRALGRRNELLPRDMLGDLQPIYNFQDNVAKVAALLTSQGHPLDAAILRAQWNDLIRNDVHHLPIDNSACAVR